MHYVKADQRAKQSTAVSHCARLDRQEPHQFQENNVREEKLQTNGGKPFSLLPPPPLHPPQGLRVVVYREGKSITKNNKASAATQGPWSSVTIPDVLVSPPPIAPKPPSVHITKYYAAAGDQHHHLAPKGSFGQMNATSRAMQQVSTLCACRPITDGRLQVVVVQCCFWRPVANC